MSLAYAALPNRDRTRVMITTQVYQRDHRRLEALAQAQGRSVRALLREAALRYLQEQEGAA